MGKMSRSPQGLAPDSLEQAHILLASSYETVSVVTSDEKRGLQTPLVITRQKTPLNSRGESDRAGPQGGLSTQQEPPWRPLSGQQWAALTTAGGLGSPRWSHFLLWLARASLCDLLLFLGAPSWPGSRVWKSGQGMGSLLDSLMAQLKVLLQQPLQGLHEVRHAIVLGDVLEDSNLVHEDLQK